MLLEVEGCDKHGLLFSKRCHRDPYTLILSTVSQISENLLFLLNKNLQFYGKLSNTFSRYTAELNLC